jgi:hypothetical protein
MRKFILGTDWWTDCDDAVALRLIAGAIKAKKIQVLGVGINACMENSVASLKAFLLAEGIDGIPVGIDQDATDFGGNPPYQKRLAELMPNVTNADAEDAVRLYRRILAETNEPIEIIEIGYLQVISSVLQSKADDISEKSGLELFREKVSRVWVMAGKWDAQGEKENNFCRNMRSRIAGREFCELCPVPVTFLGWEIGYGVITGNDLDHNDHLYMVLSDHRSENGRHSWDPMLVLMALIGDEEKAGYKTAVGTASVDAESGKNYFIRSDAGTHKFVIKKREDHFYEEQINRLL